MRKSLGSLLATMIVLAVATAADAQTVTGSKTYGDWQLDTYAIKTGHARGARNSDPGTKQMHVIQQYSWNTDHKSAALVTRVRFFDARQATLMFMLPADTDRKSKVSYAVDAGPDGMLSIADCDKRMCWATTALKRQLLAMLKRGTTLFVRYRVGGEPYAEPVSLVGFTRAYAALEKFHYTD